MLINTEAQLGDECVLVAQLFTCKAARTSHLWRSLRFFLLAFLFLYIATLVYRRMLWVAGWLSSSTQHTLGSCIHFRKSLRSCKVLLCEALIWCPADWASPVAVPG